MLTVQNNILKKMCEAVGVDFNKMDFKKPDWFCEFEWTEEQENDFKKWLISYLLENKEAREELMTWPRKKSITRAADEFIFNYGWKTNKKISIK